MCKKTHKERPALVVAAALVVALAAPVVAHAEYLDFSDLSTSQASGPDWTEFLLEAMSFDSMAGIARSDHRSETTPPYWLAKLIPLARGRPGRHRPLRARAD